MFPDWNDISPPLFEKLCAAILKNTGFTNIQWYGEAGSDKGRDIIAEKVDVPVPGVERREVWMVQCKRYTQKSLSKSELKELLDAALEHRVDSVLIIVTSTVSANLRDWMVGAITTYPFKAYVWEELDFGREVRKHQADLLDAIPELTAGKQPLWLYPRRNATVNFSCNDFEEVEIRVCNTNSVEEAKQKANDFLRYLRSNGFEWWD